MISLVRVDNRLIHGQVVEGWLPYLNVPRVVVADDEAAQSPLIRAAMGLAVQNSVQVAIEPLNEVDYSSLSKDGVKTLLLLRNLEAVTTAMAKGLELTHLNLGNVHFATGRRKVSASVFLSPEEIIQLKMLGEKGVDVEVRAVPSDRSVPLAEIVERFEKGS